jgi:dolichol-phosphate mannosyltransferase
VGVGDLVRRFPWARFVKFGVVGGSGVVVNWGVDHLGEDVVGAAPWIATAASIAVSILTNYLFNEAWTFRDRRSGGRSGFLRRLGRFYLVSLVGAAIQWAVWNGLRAWLGVHRDLAMLAGIALATIWNFFANLLWTWGKRGDEAGAPPGA